MPPAKLPPRRFRKRSVRYLRLGHRSNAQALNIARITKPSLSGCNRHANFDRQADNLPLFYPHNTIYAQIKAGALGRLDALYQNQVDASMDAIGQAQKIRLDENMKTEDMVDYLDGVLEKIERYRQLLNKYNT